MEDYSYKKLRNSNPRETANILSVLTFFYTLPTFLRGREITEDDLYETMPDSKSSTLGNLAQKLWMNEIQHAKACGRKPLLQKVLIKLFGRQYLGIGLITAFIEFFVKPYQTIALGQLISQYTVTKNDEVPLNGNSEMYAAIVIGCSFLILSVSHPCIIGAAHIGMKIRIACSCLIYRKILKFNQTALKHTTPGQVTNLLSNDVNVFDRFVLISQYIWIGPIQAIIVVYLMYKEVGFSSIFGIMLLLMFLPFYFVLGKLISKCRIKTSTIRDERIRLMNEIINGIRVVKMYTWEKPLAKIIFACRKLEIEHITKASYMKGTFSFYSVFVTTSLFITIAASAFFNERIEAKSVFILSNLYFTLGASLTVFFPQGIALLKEAVVSTDRILEFLLHDEMPKRKKRTTHNDVIILSGYAHRDKFFGCTNLNLRIERGKLTIVIGPVGCGKSTLLQIVLGELPLASGYIHVGGSLSYASQDSWLFSGSARQNILFGRKLNVARYNQVVSNCGLVPDFKLFPYGDRTTVSENGASLSGGQKARMNLARAVYKQADIYLLDDPLSSVDVHVGKQIFEDCIQAFLKAKTVILVTHQLQYLKHADHVVVLENGAVKIQGPPSELQRSNFDFAYVDKGETKSTDNEIVKSQVIKSFVGQLPKSEEQRSFSGFISWSIYRDYVLSCKSYLLIFSSVLLFGLTQILISGAFYFLAFWVNLEERGGEAVEIGLYIYVCCAITAVNVLLAVLRFILFVKITMKSSRTLHNEMFNGVISSSLQFFNLNSSGRILNRFSKDLGVLDEVLPNTIFIAVRSLLSVIGIVFVICLVNPTFLLPTAVIAVVFYFFRKFYLTSSLNIRRIEGISRSSIFGHVNESLQGLTTIRAFGMQKTVTYEFDNHLDVHSSAFDLSLSTDRAFGYWTDGICFIYATIITLYYVFIANETSVGNVGLVITQAMQLMGQLQYGIKQTTEMENCMTSVERILEYKSLEHEHESFGMSIREKPPSAWPAHGHITFENVFLKYNSSSPYILKNLNFTVPCEGKIGIVGRTGAGKSSLVTALFQLAEIEGTIIIDQIDIKSLDLHYLRKKIYVIPQTPVLFSGTVRKNLDPFDEFDDEVLWKALAEVKLNDIFTDLNSKILQNGSNLSVGQRQLICLARAVIQRNNILILDEATANVDIETENVIQETVKNNFSHCTVLTITHRLNTVMDCDMVLVMEDGKIIEYERPSVLLQNTECTFYKMIQQTKQF